MKKLVSTFAIVVVLSAGANAFAEESISQIAADKAVKEALLSALKGQIQRHQAMTQEEIIAELTQQSANNLQVVAQLDSGNVETMKHNSELALQQFAAMGKDAIIAIEMARLQAVQSSSGYSFGEHRSGKNYIFLLTRWNHEWVESSSNAWDGMWTLIAMPFAIVGDIVLFPFEVIATVTSFM